MKGRARERFKAPAQTARDMIMLKGDN